MVLSTAPVSEEVWGWGAEPSFPGPEFQALSSADRIATNFASRFASAPMKRSAFQEDTVVAQADDRRILGWQTVRISLADVRISH